MTPAERDELLAIRAEQEGLQAKLQALVTRLERLEQPGKESPVATKPPPLPPPLPTTARPLELPSALPLAAPPAADPGVEPALPLPVPVPVPAAARESLEMQIGTTWLVRAGVVLVLTSLAFLGSYLYYHVVPTLGPAAKIALLYAGAGALTALGAWLDRRRFSEESEGLRNYARVILAGGLAAVYYVTYVAHYNPHLRVVASPFAAGALLLGWAAFMVWVADRRGSELLATFTILLAFYTSAVNEISSFTLVANLFLAGGAVYLLRRHLWRVFPFVSILATFGSYGFWHFSRAYIEGSALNGATPPRLAIGTAAFWVESAFLLLNWLLFTGTVFTSDDRVFPRWRRAGFVTVNNSAFFLLTTALLLPAYPGSFWKWSLGFGSVLLILAETSRRTSRSTDPDTENAYLLQGGLLVTLGFIGYFSGWQLSLVLAVQSAVLLWLAGVRVSRWLLGSSCAVAVASLAYGLIRLEAAEAPGSWSLPALAEGAFLLGNAGWSQRLLVRCTGPAASARPGTAAFARLLGPVPAFYGLLGALIWLCMIERLATTETGAVVWLAGGAILLAGGVHGLRVRALGWYSQAFLTLACVHRLTGLAPSLHSFIVPPVWSQAELVATATALGHWWQWRRTTAGPWRHAGSGPAAWNGVLAVALLLRWLSPTFPTSDAGWMAESAFLSLLVLGYGVATRYPALAAAGQLLLASSILRFVEQWDHPWSGVGAERSLAASPWLAMLGALAISRHFAPPGRLDRGWTGRIVALYEFVAAGLFVAWAARYLPAELHFAVECVGGAVVFALACRYGRRRWLFLSLIPTVCALAGFWLVGEAAEHQSWLALAGALVLAGQQQFARRTLRGDASGLVPAPAHTGLITAAVLCAWAFVTARMGRWEGSAFTLAASWALFAPLVFAAGLGLRERGYRWLGLVILAATLAHIVFFDISQLDALGKAVSFFVLGLVALGIGFFYVRFQAKFRNFL